ncbi:hypothetical protein ACMXYN_08925 [Neptuniibacter sp. PT8_73]|uniref:hypothetical protein n=1 Tax=Neptuniibacter sp. PT8_73 TaxID=3398206 RepID=UPI0039F4B2F8
MEELAEGIFKPIFRLVLWILRILQFLAWDLLVSSVGWSIGWFFYRTITFGYFPKESLGDLESCSWSKALFVELTGLAILASLIVFISGLV